MRHCDRCGASTFSWDGGRHRCLEIGQRVILGQAGHWWLWTRVIDEEYLKWLTA